MARTGADLIIETLHTAGVKRIYGVAGDSLNGITDSLRRDKTIEWVHMRHEEAGAFAAGDKALARISEFAPGALVVALGLDASESDPLQGLKVTGAGFHAMARKIAGLGLPTVLVQEGGYLSDDLGRNLVQFLAGFEEGRK